MIADLDETLSRLLSAELPITNGSVEISFVLPSRQNSARWTRPTINLFLYDVKENNVLRERQWETVKGKNGSADRKVYMKRTPVRLDCFYMLTTWASEPADEHRLLSRCLVTLFRFPVLPEAYLTGSLQSPVFDIQARVASHDKLTNPAEIWASLDNEMRPSISYLVTLALDPWKGELSQENIVLDYEVRAQLPSIPQGAETARLKPRSCLSEI